MSDADEVFFQIREEQLGLSKVAGVASVKVWRQDPVADPVPESCVHPESGRGLGRRSRQMWLQQVLGCESQAGLWVDGGEKSNQKQSWGNWKWRMVESD